MDTPSSPERGKPTAELTDSERLLLNIDSIDEWRTRQHGILVGLREADFSGHDTDYIDVFNENVENTLDEFLEEKGYSRTSPAYDSIRELYRNSSIDKIRDSEWYAAPDDAGGNEDAMSARSAAMRDIESTLKGDEAEDDEETKEELSDLEILRLEKYAAFARKVNGPAFGKARKELQAEYDLAEQKYLEAMKADLQQRITKQFPDGFEEDELKSFVEEQVNVVAEIDEARQREECIAMGGRKARVLAWYANLSTGKKIAASFGLAAGAAGVGFLLGAAGAAVAVTATAVAAGRFGRGYVTRLSKLYESKKRNTSFSYEGDAKDAVDAAVGHLHEVSDMGIREAEKVKRRAVYYAVGAVAVGGILGTAAHVVADSADIWSGNINTNHWPGGYAQHQLEKNFNMPGEDNPPGAKAAAQAVEASSGGSPPPSLSEYIESHTRSGDPYSPIGSDYGSSGAEAAAQGHEVVGALEQPIIAKDIYVESGHGLIREMKESAVAAGYKIDGKTAEELYEAVRAEFGDEGIIDVHGVVRDTYTQAGDLRINAPGDAEWREGVPEFMQKWLAEHNPDAVKVNVDTPPAPKLEQIAAPEASEAGPIDTPASGQPPSADAAPDLDTQLELTDEDAIKVSKFEVPAVVDQYDGGDYQYSVDYDGDGLYDAYITEQQHEKLAGVISMVSDGGGEKLITVVNDIVDYLGVPQLSLEDKSVLFNKIGSAIEHQYYENSSVPIVSYNAMEGWVINEAPEGSEMPRETLKTISSMMAQMYQRAA